MTLRRTLTMSCRPKVGVLLCAVVLIFLVQKTIYFTWEGHIRHEEHLKQLEKDKSLAKIKRISSNFASFQRKYTFQSKHFTDQAKDDAVSFTRNLPNISNKTKSDLKERTPEELNSRDSYRYYISDTVRDDLQDVYVNLHKYEYTLNNKYACNGNVLAVILVNSAPDKPSERMQIRNTWGSVRFHSGATVVTLFAIAQTEDDKLQSHIESESKQYVDIIQGNFLDSYRNLTYKTVMGLDWVHKFCNHTKFVLKVDDDTLIDTYHLVEYLLQRSPDGDMEDFLYCSTFRNQGPIRRSDDKWFVPMTEYPYSKYPPYCEGFAYIMSYDVSKKLYEATETVKIYWIDDVYLTGLAAIQAGITHTNMESGHSYKLLDTDNLSKIVQSSLFLLAKYDSMRPNWDRAWDDIKSLHKK